MWWLSLALAQAVPDEEILVWGDPFARWDQRWVVSTEIHFPTPFVVLGARNVESRVDRLIIAAVLDCGRDGPLGSLLEVDCTIEDLSLVGLMQRKGGDDVHVMTEADAAMTGARLQLQVSAKGTVPNVDLEGLGSRTRRDRQRIEGYRQILSRVILPFHMGLPKVITPHSDWEEFNSRLLSMPSDQASGGASRLVHMMRPYDGQLLVQTIGEAMIRPIVGIDSLAMAPDGMPTVGGQAVDSYRIEMNGVALIDPDNGILTERVWTMAGELTASSPRAAWGRPFYYEGQLRMLGDGERPRLGPSRALNEPEEWLSRIDRGTPP